MPKRLKKRRTLEENLASCSDTLFPAEMGKAPVRIDSTDVDGDTALHVMMWRNDAYGAKCLINAGADVNAIGDMSETPLHVALRQENVEMISVLLDKGSNPNIVSEFGQTPRSMAAALGKDIGRLFTNYKDHAICAVATGTTTCSISRIKSPKYPPLRAGRVGSDVSASVISNSGITQMI